MNGWLVGWCVQSQYEKHKEVSTAQGVKILGKDLEKALAGLPLLVAQKEDEVPVLRVTLTHTCTHAHAHTHTRFWSGEAPVD